MFCSFNHIGKTKENVSMPSKKRTRIENAEKTVTKEHLSGARLEEWLTDWRRSTSPQTHTYRRAGDISPRQSVVWVCVEGGTHAAGVTTHTGTLCVCVPERAVGLEPVCCDVSESTERWITVALLIVSLGEICRRHLHKHAEHHRHITYSRNTLYTGTQTHLWTPDSLVVHSVWDH